MTFYASTSFFQYCKILPSSPSAIYQLTEYLLCIMHLSKNDKKGLYDQSPLYRINLSCLVGGFC